VVIIAVSQEVATCVFEVLVADFPKILILEIGPFARPSTVEELSPSKVCLLFERRMKTLVNEGWVNRCLSESVVKAVNQEGYKSGAGSLLLTGGPDGCK
jgi:hypothetical protein